MIFTPLFLPIQTWTCDTCFEMFEALLYPFVAFFKKEQQRMKAKGEKFRISLFKHSFPMLLDSSLCRLLLSIHYMAHKTHIVKQKQQLNNILYYNVGH